MLLDKKILQKQQSTASKFNIFWHYIFVYTCYGNSLWKRDRIPEPIDSEDGYVAEEAIEHMMVNISIMTV